MIGRSLPLRSIEFPWSVSALVPGLRVVLVVGLVLALVTAPVGARVAVGAGEGPEAVALPADGDRDGGVVGPTAVATAGPLRAAAGSVGSNGSDNGDDGPGPVTAAGGVVVVDADGGGDVRTVQAGVDAAAPDGRVIVRAGTYDEQVTIRSNVTVVGRPGAVLQGPVGASFSPDERGIRIVGDAAPVIDGLDVRGYDYGGVSAVDSTGAWTVRNLSITRTALGVNATGSSGDWRIENVTITNESDRGVIGLLAIDTSSDWTLTRSTISGFNETLFGLLLRAGGILVTGQGFDGGGTNDPRTRGLIKDTNLTDNLVGLTLGSEVDVVTRRSVIADNFVGVFAVVDSGRWEIENSVVRDNVDFAIGAEDAASEGDATRNWWGSPAGPDADDCLGNVNCSAPLTEPPEGAGPAPPNDGGVDLPDPDVATNFGPEAALRVRPRSPAVDEAVQFDAGGSRDPDGSIASYEWDFGDDGSVDATGAAVERSFEADTYEVALTVTDDDGATSRRTRQVTVRPPEELPDAAFAVSVLGGTEPLTVADAIAFDATGSSAPGDRTVATYRWQFGDGSTATGPRPRHSYDEPGRYEVRLLITDSEGVTDAVTRTLAVGSPAEPTVTRIDPEKRGNLISGIGLTNRYVATVASTDPVDRVEFVLADGDSRERAAAERVDGTDRRWAATLPIEGIEDDGTISAVAIDVNEDRGRRERTVRTVAAPAWLTDLVRVTGGIETFEDDRGRWHVRIQRRFPETGTFGVTIGLPKAAPISGDVGASGSFGAGFEYVVPTSTADVVGEGSLTVTGPVPLPPGASSGASATVGASGSVEVSGRATVGDTAGDVDIERWRVQAALALFGQVEFGIPLGDEVPFEPSVTVRHFDQLRLDANGTVGAGDGLVVTNATIGGRYGFGVGAGFTEKGLPGVDVEGQIRGELAVGPDVTLEFRPSLGYAVAGVIDYRLVVTWGLSGDGGGVGYTRTVSGTEQLFRAGTAGGAADPTLTPASTGSIERIDRDPVGATPLADEPRPADAIGADGTVTRITENRRTDASPAVAATDGGTLVVWSSADPDPDADDSDLYAATRSDATGSWGARTRITDDDRPVLQPAVAADGSAVAWNRIRAGENDTFAGTLNRLEVAVATRTDGGWSAPRVLTDDDRPDLAPTVASTGDATLVAWSRDTDGDVATTADREVLVRLFDADGAATANLTFAGEYAPRAVAADGGIALLTVADGDPDRVIRREVATDGTVAADAADAAYDAPGIDPTAVALTPERAAWIAVGGPAANASGTNATARLVTLANGTRERTPLNVTTVEELRFAGASTVVYRARTPSDPRPRIYYRTRIGGRWTAPRALTGDAASDPDAVATPDGFLTVVEVGDANGTDTDADTDTRSDLFAVDHRFRPDLTVDAAVVDAADVGDRARIRYVVRNTGDRRAGEARLAIASADRLARTVGPLAPGARASDTVAVGLAREGVVRLAVDTEGAVLELNESRADNRARVTVARPDLTVRDVTERRVGDRLQVTVELANRGPVPATNVSYRVGVGWRTVEGTVAGIGANRRWNATATVNASGLGTAVPLAVTVDPDDRIEEADETNNRLEGVALRPDVGVSRPVTVLERGPGTWLRFRLRSGDTGAATAVVTVAAGNATRRYRVPVPPARTAGDTTYRPVSVLAPAGTNATDPNVTVRVRPAEGLDADLGDNLARAGTATPTGDRPIRIANVTADGAGGVAVRVALSNDGPEAVAGTVVLAANGSVRTDATAVVPPGGETVELRLDDVAPGTETYTVATSGDNRTVTVDVVSVRVPGGTGPATDPDGDGRYEDVTGDGGFDILDVAVLLEAFDRVDADAAAFFDFNGDDRLDILDVAALLEEL